HLIIVFNDITETMEAQEKQSRLLTELQRSNEALQEFTRAASHDLKEPIRKIVFFSGKLKYLLNDKLTEDESQLLERVEKSSERMKGLVEDLLEYSYVEQNGREKEATDLNTVLALILSDLELPINEKNAIVKVANLPVVDGYRRQLQQLFQNLVSNALKYHKSGVQPEINISVENVTGKSCGFNVPDVFRERDFYLINVQDNGIGFAQSDAERIFNIFTRLHGNNEYSGTGIGLAIVRKVVENHGGYICAESEPGEGACFHVLLPAK
ncbi:MAG TPA: ATP-binding protein, partial [Flavisolibacter sp.]|nr:ATP-binding protein [Flavisolibacter sp.]